MGGRIMKKTVRLRLKKFSYLEGYNNKGKKEKGPKIVLKKEKLKFQDYKNSSQIIKKVNYLEKKAINVDSVEEDKKDFIENRLLLKSQQRFKSDKHNVLTEEMRKIVFCSNDNKRIQ